MKHATNGHFKFVLLLGKIMPNTYIDLLEFLWRREEVRHGDGWDQAKGVEGENIR